MDNAPVSMMTTIHQLKGRIAKVLKERKRPGLKSSNAAGVKRAKVFSEGEWKVLLNIPKCINDYNNHMGGVDIADQYWSYYDTQLISLCTWFPIFFWLLDTALINSFIMYSNHGISLEHKEFRIQVAWSLILSFVEVEKYREITILAHQNHSLISHPIIPHSTILHKEVAFHLLCQMDHIFLYSYHKKGVVFFVAGRMHKRGPPESASQLKHPNQFGNVVPLIMHFA